jgi:excisionase family DNA binding protein
VNSELINVDEAAQRTGSSPWTWRAHIKRGNVKTIRIGRRVLISRAELERVVREGLPSLKAEKQQCQ